MKNRKRTRAFRTWNFLTLICFVTFAFFFLYPLLNLLIGGIWSAKTGFNFAAYIKFFSTRYYISAVINSFKVSITSTILSICTGTIFALIMRHYKIKGKKSIDILLLVSTITPPFLGGYSWILLGGRAGAITKVLNRLFHTSLNGIYGFWGIVFTFVVASTPTMYMYISGALKNIDYALVEAAESLGCTGLGKVRKIILPLILPTVLSTSLLSFMRAFADFGAAKVIGEGYNVLGTLIYNSFLGEVKRDAAMASAIATITLLFTTLLFTVQRYFANRRVVEMSALRPIEQKEVHGVRAFFSYGYIYIMTLLAILPICTVTFNSFQKTSGMLFLPGFSLASYQKVFRTMGLELSRTYLYSLMAIGLILLIGIIISYANVRHRSPLTKLADTLTVFPFIVPGAVLGIAMILSFNGAPFYLNGTALLIIMCWVIRRLPYTIRSSTAILHQISSSVEEASQSLGANGVHTFGRVTLPIMFSGILPGALLSWVSSITELSCTVFIFTSKTMTMSIAIYGQIQKGNFGVASAMSTILLFSAILVLGMLFKLSKGRFEFSL